MRWFTYHKLIIRVDDAIKLARIDQISTVRLMNLTIFKCFSGIFSLKKKTIQFSFSSDFYFNKELQSLFKFMTSQTRVMIF